MSRQEISAAQLLGGGQRFDALIDVRSPGEFAEDHLPGAQNWPVLDDEQRRIVGTLYTQVGMLEARKIGAAMVARNMARQLELHVADKPRDWRPLVYCWRGGQRSGALGWFLAEVGFRVTRLEGGYKAWRAAVREELATLPQRFHLRVLCGRTGSGKTRLLGALAAAGAQVLDLEALACHRGSMLGALPGQPQPTQKAFETAVWSALRGFQPGQPVYLESESKRVGALRVPEALIEHMRKHGECVVVDMPLAARVELLLQDYRHFMVDPPAFARLLDGMVELRGRAQVAAWQAQALHGDWAGVFEALMHAHYDPLYERSLRSSFTQLAQAPHLHLADGSTPRLAQAARQLLQWPCPASRPAGLPGPSIGEAARTPSTPT